MQHSRDQQKQLISESRPWISQTSYCIIQSKVVCATPTQMVLTQSTMLLIWCFVSRHTLTSVTWAGFSEHWSWKPKLIISQRHLGGIVYWAGASTHVSKRACFAEENERVGEGRRKRERLSLLSAQAEIGTPACESEGSLIRAERD